MKFIRKVVKTLRKNARAISIATWIGIIVNTLLAILKGIGGVLSGSKALLADALHSASDIVGSIVILFAVKVAVKPPDEEHPYGHGKAENEIGRASCRGRGRTGRDRGRG